jgi:hypothetical protein
MRFKIQIFFMVNSLLPEMFDYSNLMITHNNKTYNVLLNGNKNNNKNAEQA